MPLRTSDPLDVAWERRRFALFGGLFIGIALLVGLDLGADARVGSTPRHLLMEGGIFLLATVRQQARNLYKKAGLSGRHDLAAFFLEDLLTPRKG